MKPRRADDDPRPARWITEMTASNLWSASQTSGYPFCACSRELRRPQSACPTRHPQSMGPTLMHIRIPLRLTQEGFDVR